MSNFAAVLRDEIRRLARKEARAQVARLKKDVVRLKKTAVQLRRATAQLTRDNALLLAAETRRHRAVAEGGGKARVTAKGIRALRRKLGLSQGDFAKLAGVSAMSVFLWEKKKGALRVKDETRAKVLALRGVGAREAKRRVELLGGK